MNIKKLVLILILITLVAFSIGFFSLKHYGYKIQNKDNIDIGFKGISIKDGDSSMDINLDGIQVVDGKDKIKIRLDKNNVNEIKTETVEKIENINIETSLIDINIIPEKRKDIKIHYNGYIKSNYIPELKTKKSGNTLYITTEKNSTMKSHKVYSSNLKFDIYIPIDFKDNIDIITSSGDINIHDMNLNNLSIKTSSGKQTLKNIIANNSNFLTNSGNVETYKFTGNTCITTSSGDVYLDYETFNNNIIIATSSGDVEIKLPSNSQFQLNVQTSSGQFKSSFPLTITEKLKNNVSGKIGNSTNSINITTSSGDISINPK